MTSDVLVWYEVAWVASIAGVLLVVFLLLYLGMWLTDLDKDMLCSLTFLSSCVFLTFFLALLSMHWCSQVKARFGYPIIYLLFMGSSIVFPLSCFALPCRSNLALTCMMRHYMEVVMVILTCIIIVCLNILLFSVYEYCQQCEDIDTSVATQPFISAVAVFSILCTIGALFYPKDVDHPFSLVFLIIVIWFATSIIITATYTLSFYFESLFSSFTGLEIWFWSDIGTYSLSLVALLCCTAFPLSLFCMFCDGSVHQNRYPGFYYWLSFLMWLILSVTVVVTYLVHVPPSNSSTKSCLADAVGECHEANAELLIFSSASNSSSSVMTVLSPSPAVEEATPTQPVKRCVEVDRDSSYEVQLKHLLYLEYLHKGTSRELRIIEDILGYCDELADKFGFKTVSHSCSKSDAESCCRSVFKEWQVRDSPGYAHSWNGLLKALRELGLKRLVKNIETALNCVVSA